MALATAEYDWYRGMLAYYSFHHSNGTGALGDWIPFRCEAAARVGKRPDSAALVNFLARGYCSRRDNFERMPFSIRTFPASVMLASRSPSKRLPGPRSDLAPVRPLMIDQPAPLRSS